MLPRFVNDAIEFRVRVAMHLYCMYVTPAGVQSLLLQLCVPCCVVSSKVVFCRKGICPVRGCEWGLGFKLNLYKYCSQNGAGVQLSLTAGVVVCVVVSALCLLGATCTQPCYCTVDHGWAGALRCQPTPL